jgi:hypothetical protein
VKGPCTTGDPPSAVTGCYRGLKPQLQETFPEAEKGQACDKAAAMVGATPHYVTDAKKIEQDAPEVLDHVKQGKLSIPQALKIATLPVT